MHFENIVNKFRETGQCSMCDSVIGIACKNCSTYLLPSELYCPGCGTSMDGHDEDTPRFSMWSSRERELLRLDLQKVDTESRMTPEKAKMDQDDIDDLFE